MTKSVQLAIRVEPELLELVERIRKLDQPLDGMEFPPAAAVIRGALWRGLDSMLRELTMRKKKKGKRPC